MILLGYPFFRIPTGEIMANGYIVADKHTGLSLISETVTAYFTNTFEGDKRLVIIAFTVGIVALMQFVAGMLKRKRTKLIIATAYIMTMILVAGMLYILNSDIDVNIRWGFYSYLAVQLVLAGGTPVNGEKEVKEDKVF